MNGLSESIAAKELNIDDALSRLFTSGTIFNFANHAQGSLSVKLKRTTVTMITSYTSFFENHTEFLAPMLNFLFNTLEDPKLVNVSSIAIESVCSSCRNNLVSELGAFLDHYRLLLARNFTNSVVRERIIGGIASIVEALSSNEAKYDHLATLIQLSQDEFATAVHYFGANKLLPAQGSILHALNLLVNIGKALRAPDDFEKVTNPSDNSTYWSHGMGATLQNIIYEIVMHANRIMPWSGGVIGAICQILRAGYSEIVPGLFSFPPNVTVEFVLASTLETARLDYVFETASAMLAKKPEASHIELQTAAFSILDHAKGLLSLSHGMEAAHSLTGPSKLTDMSDIRSQDPELKASIIELMQKMIPNYMQSMTMLGAALDDLFALALLALAGEQVLLKRAAAHFWVTRISIFWRSENDRSIRLCLSNGTSMKTRPPPTSTRCLKFMAHNSAMYWLIKLEAYVRGVSSTR